MLWVEHLEMMDYLRSSVNLRAYGQRDPLAEYRKEGLRLFKELEEDYVETVLKMIPNMSSGALQAEEQEMKKVSERAKMIGGNVATGNQTIVKREEDKIGRNDPCSCGSGKKYKKCGLLNTDEHQANLKQT